VPRPEDEEIEAVRAGDERVLQLVGALDDAVARADLVDDVVLPGKASSAEDVVDLLGGAVRVWRRRQLPRRDTNAVDADAFRAGGVAEPLPGHIHLALGTVVLLDVVPVREAHRRNLVARGSPRP
jgi:hypothetical protein